MDFILGIYTYGVKTSKSWKPWTFLFQVAKHKLFVRFSSTQTKVKTTVKSIKIPYVALGGKILPM